MLNACLAELHESLDSMVSRWRQPDRAAYRDCSWITARCLGELEDRSDRLCHIRHAASDSVPTVAEVDCSSPRADATPTNPDRRSSSLDGSWFTYNLVEFVERAIPGCGSICPNAPENLDLLVKA